MNALCQGQGDIPRCAPEPEPVISQSMAYTPLKIIGFNGKIRRGLAVHPDGEHMVYAIGRFVIIEELALRTLGKQRILANHKGNVTALAVSPDGQYIGSSQESPTGQKATVLLWDYPSGTLLMEKQMHKKSVYALTFTYSSKFLLSLGSQDDGKLVVWSCRHREPFCGHVAQAISSGVMLCMAASKIDDRIFATAGDGYGRIWKLDDETKNFTFNELTFHIHTSRRVINCMEICDQDNKDMPLLVCGTSTGDVCTYHLKTGCLQCVVKFKPAAHGLTSLTYVRLKDAQSLDLLVGTAGGELHHCLLKIVTTKDGRHHGKLLPSGNHTNPWKHCHDTSAITSIAKVGQGESIYVASHDGHMYCLNLIHWHEELVHTSNSQPIEALTFARDTDDLLVVGNFQTVRIINTSLCLEVRRYFRANRLCKAVAVNHDGTCIFSGWDCGTVIVLGFGNKGLELKEIYRMVSVQTQSITCLALTSASDILVSGGKDGQTRVWRLTDDLDASGKRLRQGLLIHSLAGQAGAITCLKIAKSQQTFASSSEDGTVVIHDIASGTKLEAFKMGFGLNSVSFINDDLHIMASGQDGSLHFWEILTMEYLRELKACHLGPVTWADASNCTKYATSVGKDELVKFWNLETGEIEKIGPGHGDMATKVKYGPCGTIIVSGAIDGSLCIWRNPNCCTE